MTAELSSTASFKFGSRAALGDQFRYQVNIVGNVFAHHRLSTTNGGLDRLQHDSAVNHAGDDPAPMLKAELGAHAGRDHDAAVWGYG